MKEARVVHTKFNLLIWRNLPKCKEIVKSITASMDGTLLWRDWILMKIHLLSCDPCINFLKQIKFIRETLRAGDEKLGQEDTSVKLSDDARSRLKDSIRSTTPATD